MTTPNTTRPASAVRAPGPAARTAGPEGARARAPRGGGAPAAPRGRARRARQFVRRSRLTAAPGAGGGACPVRDRRLRRRRGRHDVVAVVGPEPAVPARRPRRVHALEPELDALRVARDRDLGGERGGVRL